jgi:hypothetical protein
MATEFVKSLFTAFDEGTPLVVQALLEDYRSRGRSIRLFFGDPESGLDWLEENDVQGSISRSCGPRKVPLLIRKGESGGPAILTRNIVRALDGATGQEVYRHPKYQEPKFQVRPSEDSKLPFAVHLEGGPVQARFSTLAQAKGWIEFMQGKTLH